VPFGYKSDFDVAQLDTLTAVVLQAERISGAQHHAVSGACVQRRGQSGRHISTLRRDVDRAFSDLRTLAANSNTFDVIVFLSFF